MIFLGAPCLTQPNPCDPGWAGVNCDTCDSIHYGPGCSLSCAGNVSDGACLCPFEKFYDHAKWNATLGGTYANGTCNSTFQPVPPQPPLRLCKPDGVWSSHIAFRCVLTYCPIFNDTSTNTIWPVARAHGMRLGNCTSTPNSLCFFVRS